MPLNGDSSPVTSITFTSYTTGESGWEEELKHSKSSSEVICNNRGSVIIYIIASTMIVIKSFN